MALLSEALKMKFVDIRMIQRSLNKGLISQAEADKITKALTDDTDNSDHINLETLMEGMGGNSGLRD